MKLVIILLSLTLTASATTTCPTYPEFIVLDEELRAATPKVVRTIMTKNLVMLDLYAQDLEALAGCTP